MSQKTSYFLDNKKSILYDNKQRLIPSVYLLSRRLIKVKP